jgi:hypothetical protein
LYNSAGVEDSCFSFSTNGASFLSWATASLLLLWFLVRGPATARACQIREQQKLVEQVGTSDTRILSSTSIHTRQKRYFRACLDYEMVSETYVGYFTEHTALSDDGVLEINVLL